MVGAMEAAKRVINDRYRLDEVVGSGGMGVVWRAFDQRLGRSVAVKEVRFPISVTPEESAKLTRRAMIEAQSAAQLDHPNIVPVYDVIEADNQPYIIMRLIEGASLEQLIEADGPLDPIATAAIGVALLDALSAAHAANIVHRDVKPQNVLIQRDDTPLLTDFSIASVFGSGTLTGTGILLGSPGYIAPERLLTGETGPAGDLFGLGATLFHAVEGIGPFQSAEPLAGLFATASRPHPRPVRAGPVLTPIIDGLLAKEPAERLDAARARILLKTLADSRGRPTRHPAADLPVTQGDAPSESPTRQFVAPTGPPPQPVPTQQSPAAWQPWDWRATPTGEQPTIASPGPHGRPAGPPFGAPPGPSFGGQGTPSFGTPSFGTPPFGGAGNPQGAGNPPPGASQGHAGGPPPGYPPGAYPPPPPAQRPPGRRRNLVLAGAAVLLLLIGVGTGASLIASRHNDTLAATTAGREVQLSPTPSSSSATPTSSAPTTAVAPKAQSKATPSAAPKQAQPNPQISTVTKNVAPPKKTKAKTTPVGPRVLSASVSLSLSSYTGPCADKFSFNMYVTIRVSKVPASIRYSVHATSGTISETEFNVNLSSSTTYSATLVRWHQNAPIGPLGYYITVSTPSSATSNTAYIDNECTTA
jgi:serine/threonine protein kinase